MGDAAIEAFPALPTPHYRTDGGCIVVQMGDAHYQHLGDALLPKLGTHCRTDGGCYPHPMVSLYDRPEDTKVVSKYARLRHLVDTYLDAHK